MADIIQLKRGTEARWAAVNPVLADGEVALSLDVKNFKVGDGVNTWSGLDYWIGASGTVTTPEAPALTSDDAANTLSASHPLGASEILVSTNNSTYVAYSGTISVGNNARAAGYWKFKTRAAVNRNESPVAESPAFTAFVQASATLTVSATSVQAGSPVTLSFGVTMGNETTISSRILERRLAGSSAAWTTINQPGQSTGTFPYTPTESSEFRYRIVSESGEKISPVRTVTVVALPTYDTTMNAGDANMQVEYLGVAGSKFRYNAYDTGAATTPATMNISLGGTPQGTVTYQSGYAGRACEYEAPNGTKYQTTFQSNAVL